MTAIRLEDFGGMIPARAPTLLPKGNAEYSRNTWLYKGTLLGFRDAPSVYTCLSPTTKAVFRIPNSAAPVTDFVDSTWLEFDDEFTNVIRAPTIADSFNRYYFFAPTTAPKYNSLARITAGSPAYLLGVPIPETAPTVEVTGGGSGVLESRAYVYTWQTGFGEEGAPAPPTVVTGWSDGTWNIGLTLPLAGDTANRNLTGVNIYRTITDTSGGSTFFLVASRPIATTAYADTALDTTLTGGTQLSSTSWTPPPSNLQGCIAMPNGMLVGWANTREIWFCEPYRPHAWPAAYTISVEFPIVGLAAIGSSLAIMTSGCPYSATGVTPSTMSLSKIPANEPCVSRGSIAQAAEGIYYASINGLMMINVASASVISDTIITRRDWADRNPASFAAARYKRSYIAFTKGSTFSDGSGDNGLIIDSESTKVAFNHLRYKQPVTNAFQDELSGDIFVLAGGKVYEWDAETPDPLLPTLWRSGVMQFEWARSFAAARCFFKVPPTVTITPPSPGTRNVAPVQVFNPATQYLILRVYADGNLVLTREIQVPGELIANFPDGLKADMWQFELEGQVEVENFQVATSIKELRSV